MTRTRTIRWWLLVLLLGAAAAALWQRRTAHTPASGSTASWPPFTPAEPVSAATVRWMPPVDGVCPAGFPVKANDNSGIFHTPGGRFYTRTVPERCYATEDAALADGYRRAKA